MIYYVSEAKSLKEENKEMYEVEHGMYIKCISLYIVTLLFLRLYNEIFDTSELNDMIKYMVGLFLGSTYIGLLNKDIHDNRNGTKERRDLINRLKTMKEDYKKMHDEAVNEIDYIFAVNTNLWKELDKERVKVK